MGIPVPGDFFLGALTLAIFELQGMMLRVKERGSHLNRVLRSSRRAGTGMGSPWCGPLNTQSPPSMTGQWGCSPAGLGFLSTEAGLRA